MDQDQFNELMDLKDKLYTKKIALKDLKLHIADKQKEYNKILSKLQEKYDLKFKTLYNDAEKRAEAGCKNQGCWETKIKKDGIFKQEEKEIEVFKENIQKKTDLWNGQLEDLKLKVSDLSKELTIKLEFYKTPVPFVVESVKQEAK